MKTNQTGNEQRLENEGLEKQIESLKKEIEHLKMKYETRVKNTRFIEKNKTDIRNLCGPTNNNKFYFQQHTTHVARFCTRGNLRYYHDKKAHQPRTKEKPIMKIMKLI